MAIKLQTNSYYEKGILYRVLQKNDNYKELFSNLEGIKPGPNYDIENLSKVSINLRRKENYIFNWNGILIINI